MLEHLTSARFAPGNEAFGDKTATRVCRTCPEPQRSPGPRRAGEAGLSLLEILIAMTVSLVLLGGAIRLFVVQLDANRRLLLGARIQQDLQLATGLVARGLRRTGYLDADGSGAAAWRLSGGAIQMKLDDGNWQTMTDAETMTVTAFAIAKASTVVDLAPSCVPPCTAGNGSCPVLTVNRFDVRVEARAAADASITRQLNTSVVQRNDTVTGSCS